jgi:hypothetical protein
MFISLFYSRPQSTFSLPIEVSIPLRSMRRRPKLIRIFGNLLIDARDRPERSMHGTLWLDDEHFAGNSKKMAAGCEMTKGAFTKALSRHGFITDCLVPNRAEVAALGGVRFVHRYSHPRISRQTLEHDIELFGRVPVPSRSSLEVDETGERLFGRSAVVVEHEDTPPWLEKKEDSDGDSLSWPSGQLPFYEHDPTGPTECEEGFTWRCGQLEFGSPRQGDTNDGTDGDYTQDTLIPRTPPTMFSPG